MRPLATLLLFSALWLPSCEDLPAIADTGCGNRLVEPTTEDCDGDAPGASYCGRPGEDHACRFLCLDPASNSHECPRGYACGSDGVCRTPTGSFQQVGRAIEAESSALAVGDFDDDKRADLLTIGTSDPLGRSPSQIVFFSGDAERSTVQRVPGLLGSPVVGRFSDSPYAGLAFVALPGAAMLIGRRDRQFFPRSYPFYSNLPGISTGRAYAVDALPTLPPGKGDVLLAHSGDETLLFADLGGQNILSPADSQDIFLLLPHGPSDLVGDLVWGKFNEGAHCPSLVFAFKQDSSLLVYQPCTASPDPAAVTWDVSAASTRKIPMLEGLVPQNEPVLFDLDGDQHLDIIVGVKSKKDDQPFLAMAAYGDGKGGFHQAPGGKGPESFAPFTLPPDQVTALCGYAPTAADPPELVALLKGQAAVASPLAIGDLDGDDHPDFVFSYGICTSRDPAAAGVARYRLVSTPIDASWAEARLLDINADGRLDLVASRAGARSLDFYLGGDLGFFNPGTVPLNGSADLLRVGDFDGDSTPDVAFRESGVQGTSNVGSKVGDAVTILFGEARKSPETVVRVGRYQRVEHLAAGQTHLPFFQDSISDLGVVSRAAPPGSDSVSDGPISISQILGATDRALRSPLLLNDPGEQSQALGAWIPTLLVPGRFTDQKGAQQDLMALTLGSFTASARLWLVALEGDAQLRAVAPGAVIDTPARAEAGAFNDVFTLGAGDLDGDGLDEAIFLLDTTAGHQLIVGYTEGTTVKQLPPQTVDFTSDRRSQPVVLDADADGKADLLLAVTRPGSTSRSLAVLWGKGDRTFEAPALLDLPDQQALQGLCAARGRQRPEALLLGDKQLYRLDPSRSLVASPVAQFTSEPRGGIALACGDIDGDGVDDAAVSSGSLLRVFRGTPERP